jgi:hypothetical protein
MTIDKVLEVAREVIENESIPKDNLVIIPKDNLVITYRLDKETHKELDKELFYKTNNSLSKFRHNKKIELNLGGITFLFEIL